MSGGRVPRPRLGGVPCPMSRGCTPSHVWGGTPSQVWGYPIPCPGVPHLRSGVPPHHLDLAGAPSPRPGWGTPPPARPGMGNPPGQTWDWVPPYPHLRWGTPPLRYGLTHKVKILPSPILRMRAVMKTFDCFVANSHSTGTGLRRYREWD